MAYSVTGEDNASNPMKYNKINAPEVKFKNASNATRGRVMNDGRGSLNSTSMSRPSGRTSYVAGVKTASTDAN